MQNFNSEARSSTINSVDSWWLAIQLHHSFEPRTGPYRVVSGQNAKLALEIACRGYVFSNGQVAISGTGARLRSNPEVQRIFLGGGLPSVPAGQQ
jgi:hypothetical protein